jgi:choline dehydrogenase-like flavoprotein
MVNGMAWNRGSNADYDAWEALGNTGWGWKGLGPYFKKSTHYTAPSDSTVKEYNITFNADAYGNGPVQISIPSFQFQDLKTIFGAWYHENVSFPQEGIETGLGVFWQPNDIDNKTATRSSAYVAYYVPVQGRPNLTLLTRTKVTQILTDNVKGALVATGVQILSANSTVSKVFAAKEVILAAGGVFTPHLLMLSGIGPKDILTASNITVKRELPGVGSNFQDHTPLAMMFNLSNVAFPNPTTISSNASFNASAAAQYAKDRSGPYSYGLGYAQALLPFKEVSAKYANITAQLLDQEPTQFLPTRYAKDASLLRGFKKQKEILIDRYMSDSAAITQFPIAAYGRSTVTLQKPLSRGTIELNITHPDAPPVVQWNTLMNPVDKAVLGELVRFNRVHWSRPALSGYNPVELQPGAQYKTDDEIVSGSVKTGALTPTFAHESGGCAMMPEELGGCVSDKLMVYGVGKLSIVDASLLPLIPACNLQATMYAVAEKAADIIKNRTDE